MAEWPKRLALTENFDRWRHGEHDTIEVIPADLGRELYELLHEAQFGTEALCPLCWPHDGGKGAAHGSECPLAAALARYEREVRT